MWKEKQQDPLAGTHVTCLKPELPAMHTQDSLPSCLQPTFPLFSPPFPSPPSPKARIQHVTDITGCLGTVSAMRLFIWQDDLPKRERLLLAAVERRNPEAVQQQLAAGANPSTAEHNGLSALHGAAVTGQGDMVAALVAAGADVSATFKSATPLLYMMQRIRSALWSAKDYGNNAVEFSESDGQYWTGQYLDEAATPCQPGHSTEWCEQMAGVVQQLVAAGAEVDVMDGDNCSTPLFCAAAGGCPTLVTHSHHVRTPTASSCTQQITRLRGSAGWVRPGRQQGSHEDGAPCCRGIAQRPCLALGCCQGLHGRPCCHQVLHHLRPAAAGRLAFVDVVGVAPLAALHVPWSMHLCLSFTCQPGQGREACCVGALAGGRCICTCLQQSLYYGALP
jgi:hypothetical protein